MNDGDLKEILSTYTIECENEEKILQLSAMVKSSMKRSIKTKPFSILQQMKVQATYMSKWFYCIHFIISLFLLLLLFSNNTTSSTVVFFGISPLFIIPSIVVFYKTISDGMLEIESSCKYSLSQIYAAKLLMLGIVVVTSIVCVWVLNGLFLNSFNIRPLIFGFTSFAITCVAILWFGKRNILTGFTFGGAWGVMSWMTSMSNNMQIVLESISTITAFLILIGTITIVVILMKNYSRKLTYEGEEKEWKFLSIN